MTDPVALRAQRRQEARDKRQQREPSGYQIKERTRQTLDTGYVQTTQALAPFTGKEHSYRSMASAVTFWSGHRMPNWHEGARCRSMDQQIFYGQEDRTDKARHHPNLTVDEVAKARRICNACPVQMQCLDHAIRNREEFGIWGGSTAGQRKRWIKQFEEREYAILDDDDLDLTSYDEVYGGYEDDLDRAM